MLSLVQESLGHREPIFTFALLFERGGCYAPLPGTDAGLSRPLATLSAILLLDRSLFGEAKNHFHDSFLAFSDYLAYLLEMVSFTGHGLRCLVVL